MVCIICKVIVKIKKVKGFLISLSRLLFKLYLVLIVRYLIYLIIVLEIIFWNIIVNNSILNVSNGLNVGMLKKLVVLIFF